MADAVRKGCVICGSARLYAREVAAAGGRGGSFLPGLGRAFHPAQFLVVVCADCGHTLLFADQEAREQVTVSPGWRPQNAGSEGMAG